MTPALAREGATEQYHLKFGTAAEGGSFIVYAGAFIDAMQWANPAISLKAQPTRGSIENVPLLEAGKIDLGMVSGEFVQELFNPKSGSPTPLKVICAMYLSPGMFVVRADTRYHTISDLKGRPVIWNGRGSGLARQARYFMEGLGLDPEKDFEAIYTERMIDGPEMLLEGRASALWGSGNRWPGFVKVASDARGARFITPDDEEIGRIVGNHKFLRPITVPAGRYPGQSEPLQTVGSWSYVLARADLDEAIGYGLAAALHKVERSGTLFGGQLAESTLQNTVAALPRPDALQGGFRRYLREVALLK